MQRIKERKESKSIERTVLVSALSIVLCCGALFGTTYAWMTDSVLADVATIQAGTLEVELVDGFGKSFILKDGTTQAESTIHLGFTEVEGGSTDWDMGKNYQLPSMYVVNKGTTDLIYTISIEGITDIKLDESTTVDLTDLIDFSIQINDDTVIKGTSASGTLQISDNPDTAEVNESGPDKVVISGMLKDDVNLSSYQGMEFTGITIKINAVQTVQGS